MIGMTLTPFAALANEGNKRVVRAKKQLVREKNILLTDLGWKRFSII